MKKRRIVALCMALIVFIIIRSSPHQQSGPAEDAGSLYSAGGLAFRGPAGTVSALGPQMICEAEGQGADSPVAPAQEVPGRHAIILSDGEVIAWRGSKGLSWGKFLQGPAAFDVVAPFHPGPIVWQAGRGELGRGDETLGEECHYPVVKRVQKSETRDKDVRSVTFLEIASPPLRERIYAAMQNGAKGEAALQVAYAVDLDGDGRDEIIFVVNNLKTVIKAVEKDHIPRPFLIAGGVLKEEWAEAKVFFREQGTYYGGTDTISGVTLLGLVRDVPGSDGPAFVSRSSNFGNTLTQTIWLRKGAVMVFEACDTRCL